jgi:hypothetical protein
MIERLAATLLIVAAACNTSTTSKPPLEPIADMPIPDDDEDGGWMAAAASDAGLPPVANADAGPPPAASPDDAAMTLLKQFVAPNADHAALTKSLRPTAADYKAMFDAKTAAKVEASQAKDWSTNKAVIKPKPTQTEVKVWGATGAELVSGKGNAKEFPAGYQKLAKHLVPTTTYYRFKFVEAGKETGTAYEGLAFVNGHWVIAPKAWRALEGGAQVKDEDAEPKPKPRPKKK